jgi:transposase
MVKVIRQGMAKKDAAKAFGVSRQTVWRWCERARHRGRESFRDLPREPKNGKITRKVEASIVSLRTAFGEPRGYGRA